MAGIAEIFEANAEIMGATGRVLQDGITHGGLSYEDALTCLAEYRAKIGTDALVYSDTDALYGCNMAFRASAVRGIALR